MSVGALLFQLRALPPPALQTRLDGVILPRGGFTSDETVGSRTLPIQISDGLPAWVKVNVAEYRTRKQSGTRGYG